MTIRIKARMTQSMDGDKRHVRAHFSIGTSEDDGPARGQFGWRSLGILAMPLDEWRLLRHCITVPDCPIEVDENVGPDVAVIIEERGVPENEIGAEILADQEADQLRQYEVLQDVINRRQDQDRKWGGPLHDDRHQRLDWIDFIRQWTEKAESANDVDIYEQELIDVAALAIAAVESSRRKRGA